MSSAPIPALASTEAKQRLLFFIAVDCSGSMRGERVASLNYAMRSAIPAMRAAAADGDYDVLVRVIHFGDQVRWTTSTPVPIQSFEWNEPDVAGETAMGACFEELAKALSADTPPSSDTQSVLILLSDGFPTDNIDRGLAAIAATPLGMSTTRIAIAIGADADIATLTNFMGDQNGQPLRANNAETLVNRVRWATTLSRPTTSANTGSISPDKTKQPDDGDLLW